jgi:metal-responsive CopG/Arc/MetJ family transcriptional regulator
MSVVKGRIMEAIPDHFVSIQIHMPPPGMTRLYSSVVKTAVSIPDPIFEAADRLARRRRVSRSELYAEALTKLLDSDESTEITARLDDVYGERSSELDAGLATLQALAIDEEW